MTQDLKLGLMLGYWAAKPDDATEAVLAAEDCGFDCVWTAEAYGSDAITPLTWYAARTTRIGLGTGLVQLSARTPASMAMTAATLDALSGGRLRLGLGVSGPQVVEGWYGAPFTKPLARTRAYVDILRKAWRRELVTNDADEYPLPYPGGMNLGKPLKMTLHPVREDIPIYLGAEGLKNVEMSTEIAQGWLPIFYHPERSKVMYADALRNAQAGFEIACPVTVIIRDSVEEAITVNKWTLAFYIGGMGAKDTNFHLDVVSRMGFAEEAKEIQRLFLDGDREAAVKAVPDDLADGIALCGPIERIRERLALWRESPVTQILVGGVRDPLQLKQLTDLVYG